MRHLKTFEKYKYLNDNDTAKIEAFARTFVKNKNILEKIEKLTFKDFLNNDFENIDIFESFISGRIYIDNNNIYYAIDQFCSNNKINPATTPALRNSIYKIIEKISKKYDNKLTDRLIKVLQQEPNKYIERYNLYKDEWDDAVKDACEYLLYAKKYNL